MHLIKNMKKKTTKIEHPKHTVTTVVPAKVEEVVEYVCEIPGCFYVTKDKYAAEKHYGRNHTVKEIKYIQGRTFIYFKNLSDKDEWVSAHQNDYSYISVPYFDPGWFMEVIRYNYGENEEEDLTLIYLDDAEEMIKKEIKNSIQNTYRSKDLLVEMEKLKKEMPK
jgi:hypothetical protein